MHICCLMIRDSDQMIISCSLPPFPSLQAPAPPVDPSLPLPDPAVLNGSGEGSSTDRKRKGSRTTLTPSQLQKLLQVYEYEARPTKETKLALSKATGLE